MHPSRDMMYNFKDMSLHLCLNVEMQRWDDGLKSSLRWFNLTIGTGNCVIIPPFFSLLPICTIQQGIWYRNTTASCEMTENARNGQTCISTYISKVSRVVFVIVVCAWMSCPRILSGQINTWIKSTDFCAVFFNHVEDQYGQLIPGATLWHAPSPLGTIQAGQSWSGPKKTVRCQFMKLFPSEKAPL